MQGQGEDSLQDWLPSWVRGTTQERVGAGRFADAVSPRPLAAKTRLALALCLFRVLPDRACGRPFPAHQAGETGPTVCGYMGLDGASGSAAETQKLNFEEQPDSRVRVHGRGAQSCSVPCPFLGEEGSFTRLQKPNYRYRGSPYREPVSGGLETEVLHAACARSLDHATSCHARRRGRQITGGGGSSRGRRAEKRRASDNWGRWFIPRPEGRDALAPSPEPRRNSAAPRPCTSQTPTRGSTSGWCCGSCSEGVGSWAPSTAASSRSSRSPRRRSSN